MVDWELNIYISLIGFVIGAVMGSFTWEIVSYICTSIPPLSEEWGGTFYSICNTLYEFGFAQDLGLFGMFGAIISSFASVLHDI